MSRVFDGSLRDAGVARSVRQDPKSPAAIWVFTHRGGDPLNDLGEAECTALRTPVSRQLGRVDLIEAECRRLVAVEDRLDNVGGEIAKTKNLPDIVFRMSFCVGQCSKGSIDAAFHFLPPIMGERQRLD